MNHALADAIINCGNIALALPLAGLVAVALWLRHSVRAAAEWLVVLAGLLAVMALLKSAGHACGRLLFDLAYFSPSGHAAISTMVYGSMALMAAERLPRAWAWAPLAAGGGLVAAICALMIQYGQHTAPEVAAGLAIGLAAAWTPAFRRAALPRRASVPRLALPALGCAALAAVLLLHGRSTPAERMFRQIGAEIRTAGICAPSDLAARAQGPANGGPVD